MQGMDCQPRFRLFTDCAVLSAGDGLTHHYRLRIRFQGFDGVLGGMNASLCDG